ncbi:MAG: hypothetical protein ACRD5G_09035 [Candidatus Acidiferrales bacterium]
MNDPHSISRAIASVGRQKKLALVQFAGNVALGFAAYGWLLIPEAAVWQVAASGIAGVVLVGAFFWLNSGTIVVFSMTQEPTAIWPAFRTTLRHVPALFAWLLVLLVVRELLYLADERGWAVIIASWLTLNFKRPIAPPDVSAWLLRLQTSLDWIWIFLWLPVASEVARSGFAGFRSTQAWRQTVTSLRYWLTVILLLAAGVWLPALLVNWVPKMDGFWKEVASMVLRFTPACALTLAAWLTVLALLAQHARERQVDER